MPFQQPLPQGASEAVHAALQSAPDPTLPPRGWAHFFARAYQERQLWPSKGECRSCSATPAVDFSRSFVALPETRLGKAKDIDMAPWFEAAAQLVPLARGKAAAEYSLPDEFGPHAGNLPGVLNGMHAVAHPEPECDPVGCTTSAAASAQS